MQTPVTAGAAARWLIIALALGVLAALYPFASGLLGAAVLAVAVAPLHRRLALRVGRRVAAVVVAVAALVLVLVPGALLLAWLLAQAPLALREIEQSAPFQGLAALHVGRVDLGAQLGSVISVLLSWGSRQAVALVGGLTLATLNLVIAIFGLYYLLVEGEHVWRSARHYLPFSSDTADRVRERFRRTTEGMLIGVALTAIAQGGVVGAGFALVGLPDAPFWGFVTACVSVLPVFGSALVWLPGSLVLAVDHRTGAAVVLSGIGFVLASNIDNVIRPIVYRYVSRIHPMITLVGAFAGVRVFGLAGLLLGPLALTYLVELLRAYESEYVVPTAPRPLAAPSSATR